MTLKAVDELARWQPVLGGMALRPYGEWTPYQPAADLLAAQAVENKRLREALTRIKRWHGEFPPTGRFWRDDHTGMITDRELSYSAAFGSNGERDFMREIARSALSNVALSLPTPKGKHIEDVYPDEAVAFVEQLALDAVQHQGRSELTTLWDQSFVPEHTALFTASQLLAAKQQGIAEERERCAKIAEADAAASKSNWENARGSEKAYHLWAEQAATGIAAAIRGAT